MNILGIETSCDETAAAVVANGHKLLSNVVASQIDLHKEYGGVVPEIAARSHLEVVNSVIDKAIVDARLNWDNIDAIAVTRGPGLSGSLLIGTLSARTLSLIKNKPLYGVDHVMAHVYANFIDPIKPQFPILALIVSGGHTQLAWFESHLKYRLLGQTLDDAVGEAFDKVAKIIGLEYPGGPSIAKAAQGGDSEKYALPRPQLKTKYDFSFSGLKTAALRVAQKEIGQDYNFPSFEISKLLSNNQVNDLAASFQKAAIDYLVSKTKLAYEEFQPKTVVIAGGVAANKHLREELSSQLGKNIDYAPTELCTDNAAMVATLGYYQSKSTNADDPLSLKIDPSLSM